SMPADAVHALLDPAAPRPPGAWGAFLLFLIPVGGGIPAGVLLARDSGVSPPVMAALYFLSDVVLAFAFEPFIRLLLALGRWMPPLARLGRRLGGVFQRGGGAANAARGPLGLVLVSVADSGHVRSISTRRCPVRPLPPTDGRAAGGSRGAGDDAEGGHPHGDAAGDHVDPGRRHPRHLGPPHEPAQRALREAGLGRHPRSPRGAAAPPAHWAQDDRPALPPLRAGLPGLLRPALLRARGRAPRLSPLVHVDAPHPPGGGVGREGAIAGEVPA